MPDLGLEISPRITGAPPAAALEFAVVRKLTEADLPMLDLPRSTAPGALKRIGDRHHAVARNLALGMKGTEVAAITGYSIGRIDFLKSDPAFQELIEFYRTGIDRENRSNFERLSGLAADAADLLAERMEESPDDVSTGQLIEIVKVAADRSGNGPQTSSVSVNINVGLADKMKRARELARQASLPRELEGQVLDITPREAAE